MTIDEAIEHAREVAKENIKIAKKIKEEDALYCDRNATDDIENMDYIKENDKALENCERCAKEHEQLAEWLEELKELRNITAGHLYAVAFNRGYLKAEKEVREKAIDDFERKLTTHFADWELSNTPCNDDETDRTKEIICETIENAIGAVEEMAEQLKAGGRE